MKKIIYLLSLVTVFILGSCSDDLPKASWDICQVGTLNATAQDEKVLLEWAPMQGANPTGYLVNWTPEVATYEGGSAELDAKTTSYTITGLVNKVTYTITIQAIYGNQRSMISTTKGGGVAVGKDGTLYQGARNATLYAINSDGTQKWTYATGAANKNLDCFPAVTADGQTVYILDGDNVLHSINTATGVKNWSVKLAGTKNKAGAVAIDKTGNIYVGTRTTIYGFKADGTQLWKVAGKVTEIGSFALDDETLYAAQIGGAGLLALNTADGSTKWNVEAAGDIYAPIVDKSGNIYFTDKGDKALYSVDKAGQLKWKFTIDAAPTYCFPVLDDKGTVYFGSGAGRIYAVNSANGEELWHMDSEGTDNNAKIMSGMTIGENQMLYVSYIGGNVAAIKIFAGPEKSTWSCRGGNIHGTNQY